jgi:predicted nicotinamide N-methyase
MSALHEILARIESRFQVEVVPLTIAGRTLKVLQLSDFVGHIEALVEAGAPGAVELPYWAKIWDATFMLAYFLGRLPVDPDRQMLEIGAGLGVVGVYGTLCGHRVTITDIHEDALLFARANTLLNGCPQVEVRSLDWRHPDLDRQYDVILGSEVVYERESYPSLVRFLRQALAPGGMIFLAKNAELSTPAFFQELTRFFEYKETRQNLSGDGESRQIALYAVRRKGGA